MRRINTLESHSSGSNSVYEVSRADSIMNLTSKEKKSYGERRYRWLNYLTNVYYNGTLDITNLVMTLVILMGNKHLVVGEIDED